MRTYVTIAALAVTAAACGAPAARTTASRNAAAETIDVVAFVAVAVVDADPDGATRRVSVPAPKAEPKPARPARLSYGRWRTPEAAMRYLARAYTNRDDGSLRHVTNPAAREALVAMRGYAPDLRLVGCEAMGNGTFTCTFSHAVKNSTERGSATLQANPALKPGWYATALTDCGD